jgi:hypothetical protein
MGRIFEKQTRLLSTVVKSNMFPRTTFMALGALPLVLASPAAPMTPRDVSGTSTFYGGNLNGGTCSFTTMSSLPSGIYGTAFSGSGWSNAANCGACLQVTGPNGNSIKVMVCYPTCFLLIESVLIYMPLNYWY